MKIFVLMENTASDPTFFAEHGLSLYLETQTHKILFDMGQSDRFVNNAETLGVDLRAVDLAILSHGHYDHGGGLKRFFAINDHAPVYLSSHAFEPHYSGQDRNIGLDPSLRENRRLIFVEDSLRLDSELELCSCSDKTPKFPIKNYGLTTRQNGKAIPENFRHEQYLILRDQGRKIVVSGCSHKGILNIMDWFAPDVLIGGFHLMKVEITDEGQQILDQTADILTQYQTLYFTGHCTGQEPFSYLKTRLGPQLNSLSAGLVRNV